MADLRGFDAGKVEPTTTLDPIPAGKYLAMVTASEMKPNKAGTGQFLELVFTILEGDHRNRQLWARLNLINPNELAVRIAQAELSALCRAVGVLAPTKSITVRSVPGERFDRIVDYELGEKPELTPVEHATGIPAEEIPF